jgi:hypothetical protein
VTHHLVAGFGVAFALAVGFRALGYFYLMQDDAPQDDY